MRKTGNKWRTESCGRCGTPHGGYSGKLDRNDVEYVVCQITNKRMNVAASPDNLRSLLYFTKWVKDE